MDPDHDGEEGEGGRPGGRGVDVEEEAVFTCGIGYAWLGTRETLRGD